MLSLIDIEIDAEFIRAGFTISGKSSVNLTGNYPVKVPVKEKTVSQFKMSVMVVFRFFLLFRGYLNHFRIIKTPEI